MDPSALSEFLTTRVSVFTDFPAPRLAQLIAGSRIVTYEANEAIKKFGEEGRFLGVLLDGEAEVSLTSDSGVKQRVAILGTGDIFGEMSVMTGDKTVADVVGVTRCTALLIPEELFSTVLITYPPAVKRLSRLVSERSRELALDEGGKGLAATALSRSSDPYGLTLASEEPMKLLVVNCGSSSLKYNLFDTADETRNARGVVERIGDSKGMRHTFRSDRVEIARDLPQGTHASAFAAMIELLTSTETGCIGSTSEISAVGHRVVHGGERFSGSVVIDDAVLRGIEELSALAPLHNPVNALGIREARKALPGVPAVAVFDTTFHHAMPPYAYLYGLPYEYYEKDRIRRYGFHGMSHLYVGLKAAEFLKRPFNELEIVSCHLGNGASLCAIDHGRSVNTSMGLTPAEGLIMGTRCGDIDPAVLIHLMRNRGMHADDLERLIQKESGLLGISGISNDMREIEKAAAAGDHRALLAFKTFSYRVRKYVGAYAAVMGGIDTLVFTGGVGQGSAGVRSLACQGLGFMGIRIDESRNRTARGFEEVCRISADDSPITVLVVPTDEERMIARETLRTLSRSHIGAIIQSRRTAPIPIEVSAHHVHLSQRDVEALFGTGHTLTPEAELSQPGQFACKEKVNLIGPKGRVERVRVLGPARKVSQVEIAMTEQFKLGIHPPIRESGDLENTPGITLEGSAGTVVLDKGVICAMRHIHMAPEDALKYGLRDKYEVRVRVEGDRELIFGDVLIRVHPNYRLAMHIDTDEGNAANIKSGAVGFVDAIQSRG